MKKIKLLLISCVIFLGLCIGITVVVDPFYLYHGPIPGMNEVLFESTLQVEGTIRNFEYESVLVGSSMIENVDTTFLDNKYGTKTLKVSRESGSIADLLLYLDEVHKYQNVDYVFLGLDLFALTADVEPDMPADYTPKYLFTKTFLDDWKYLLNKDILMEKIPLFLAYEMSGKYCGDKAYYFADGKNFSKEGALANYQRLDEINETAKIEKEKIDTNINNLLKEINNNKNVKYIIFYQPYSMLWWDNCYRDGSYENMFYALQKSMEELSSLENVELYNFLNEEEIVLNLDNYMDTMHFSPEINQSIIKKLVPEDIHRVKKSEVDDLTDKTREMFNKIIQDTPWL